jgi:class 3 adenylate cyclase
VERRGLEKVKTIGDAYMVVGGARSEGADTARATVALAFDMLDETRRFAASTGVPLDLRVGVHIGSVIGGVISKTRMAFDYWGDTVNLASRLESSGIPGKVQASEAVCRRVHGEYLVEEERALTLKGKGEVTGYILGRKPVTPAVAAG